MHNPARLAFISRTRRTLRAESRRLQILALSAKLRGIGFRLLSLRLKVAILVLKTPDYLTTILVTIFRRHLRKPRP